MNFEPIDILTEEEIYIQFNNALKNSDTSNIAYYWCCYCTSYFVGERCGVANYGYGSPGGCYGHGANEIVEICGRSGYCCER